MSLAHRKQVGGQKWNYYSPDVHKPQNRFRCQQSEWSTHVDLDQMTGGNPLVILTPIPRVIVLLAQPCSLLFQDCGMVCLLDCYHHENSNSAKDQRNPIIPSPSQMLVHKPPNDWASGWSVQRRDGPHGHGCSQIIWIRDIDDSSRTIRDHGGTKDSTAVGLAQLWREEIG